MRQPASLPQCSATGWGRVRDNLGGIFEEKLLTQTQAILHVSRKLKKTTRPYKYAFSRSFFSVKNRFDTSKNDFLCKKYQNRYIVHT